ncbi:hypothetical protein EB796_004905 [Bugula neritina]|uniref:Uncharacterized protein n=1 Tax=Bugula neritina TaxID=10212 RepID=A0A7J7KGL2_BUGNE|nr:hypothetical protein EB796_004905 [Bugula neritina]
MGKQNIKISLNTGVEKIIVIWNRSLSGERTESNRDSLLVVVIFPKINNKYRSCLHFLSMQQNNDTAEDIGTEGGQMCVYGMLQINIPCT